MQATVKSPISFPLGDNIGDNVILPGLGIVPAKMLLRKILAPLPVIRCLAKLATSEQPTLFRTALTSLAT